MKARKSPPPATPTSELDGNDFDKLLNNPDVRRQIENLPIDLNLISEHALDRIRTATGKLNSVADKATAYIAAVEEALAAAGVGIEVTLPPEVGSNDEGEPDAYADRHTIGYGKVKGKWCLRFETWSISDEGDSLKRVMPLRSMERLVRIEWVKRIPVLLEKIGDKVSALADVAEACIPREATDAEVVIPKRK